MNSTKTNKNNHKNLTFYILSGWFLVIAGVLFYYFGYYNQHNKFWSYPSKNAPTFTIIAMPENQLQVTPPNLYAVLAQYQNPEKLTFKKTDEIRLQTIRKNNTFYLGTWPNLNEFNSLLPDSIVSFLEAEKLLKWKHKDSFYKLPLSENRTSLTYAIVAKIQLESNIQSHLFILFDEANPILFLEQLSDEKTIAHLAEKLPLTDVKSAFIALFKVPQIKSIETEIELLEGYVLNP